MPYRVPHLVSAARSRFVATAKSCSTLSIIALIMCGTRVAIAEEPPTKSPAAIKANQDAVRKRAVETAYTFLERSPTKFGIAEPRADLHETSTVPIGASVHVRLTQYYRNVHVYGGELHIQVAPDGTAQVTEDSIARDIDLPAVIPKLPAPQAQQVALRAARLTTADDLQAELVVWCAKHPANANSRCALAWRIVVDNAVNTTPFYWQYFIDAASGEIISSEDLSKEAKAPPPAAQFGTLKTMYSGSVFEYLYKSGSYVYLQSPYFGTAVPSTNQAVANAGFFASNAKQGTGSSTIIKSSTATFGNGTLGLDVQTMGCDAFAGVEFTLETLRTFHSRDDLDGSNTWKVDARVNFPSNGATWTGGTCKCLQLGIGDAVTWPWVSIDVVGHELGHGLQESLGVLIGTGPGTKALSEGYADVLGHEVWYRFKRANANSTAQPGDYWFGATVYKANWSGSTFTPNTALRYMDDPQHADASVPACWSTAVNSMDPHKATMPFDHMYYLLSNGGTSQCNGIVVTPIGREYVWSIAFTALQLSGIDTTYSQTRVNWVNAATALYGTGIGAIVGQAFDAINVP
jgi:Zn-dependent metalloprotease